VGYRVIQWASGDVGRAAMEGVLAHPDLGLVGCWVHSTEKDGRDIGDLLDTAGSKHPDGVCESLAASCGRHGQPGTLSS
jgi:hypothetical protein